MYDCTTDSNESNEIEMFVRVEEAEAPTNGLDEIVDWDDLEAGLNSGLIGSLDEFRAVVRKMYEEKGVTFPTEAGSGRPQRVTFSHVASGLFPEYRTMLTALPAKREVAA